MLVGAEAHARISKSVGVVADPSFKGKKLVEAATRQMQQVLRRLGVRVVEPDAAPGILLHYFVIPRHGAEGIEIEMEGRAFDSDSGKLLCQQAVKSEKFADDEGGRLQAVEQAARRLAEEMVPHLESAIAALGRGRSVMLQLQAEQGTLQLLEKARDTLLKKLGKVRVRGMSSRSMIMVVEYKRPSKELAAEIEASLKEVGGVKVEWQLVSESALIGRLHQGG